MNVVERILPHVEHRMCARHIYGNLKKLFHRQTEMKNLFWRVAESIEAEQRKLKFCKMIPGGDGRYEVKEASISYSVNMRQRTCACRRWELGGIPCRHALRVITEKKLNYEDYISSW